MCVRTLNTCVRKKKVKKQTTRFRSTRRLDACDVMGARTLSLSLSRSVIELRNNDQHCILPDFSVFGLREWGCLKIHPAQCDRPQQQELERARLGNSNDLILFGVCPMHILYTLACEWSNVESEKERKRGRSERLGRTSGIRGIVYYLPRARNREQFSCFEH